MENKPSYIVTYKGAGISLNKWYAGGHWSSRNSDKDKFKKIFSVLFLQAKLKPLDTFKIALSYNSRHDPDNVIAMLKMLVDTMKGKYIIDDTKKYYKGLSIDPNEKLPNNTFVFTITEA